MSPPPGRRQAAENWGRRAEARAALFLRLKGYRVLARRYKTPWGEIDLVVRRSQTLAFIEIKARDTYEAGLEAVTPLARRRIARAAEIFLAGVRPPPREVRFDVVVVRPGAWPRHLRDAWRPSDREGRP